MTISPDNLPLLLFYFTLAIIGLGISIVLYAASPRHQGKQQKRHN